MWLSFATRCCVVWGNLLALSGPQNMSRWGEVRGVAPDTEISAFLLGFSKAAFLLQGQDCDPGEKERAKENRF